eukprot:CAMPEP_0178852852 /NCGR_PEP_ID=MMETSP0746-20121128/21901_1 /TAXON_ID=913974 /ORGANISM="Nitzschia punctata, Strain CCMP561" /LENGTH=121 /DNA_ID=CAMNT_0020518561 /DNA_START=63 /DNA_END=428 /DNA_ORIENTATION=+
MPIVKYTCAIAPKGAPATEYAFDIPVTEQEMQLARDAKNPEHGKTMNAITTRGQKLVLDEPPHGSSPRLNGHFMMMAKQSSLMPLRTPFVPGQPAMQMHVVILIRPASTLRVYNLGHSTSG